MELAVLKGFNAFENLRSAEYSYFFPKKLDFEFTPSDRMLFKVWIFSH